LVVSEATSRADKLALLVQAGEIFHRSLDIDQTLYNVARLAVDSFADICLFDLIDDRSDRLYVTAGAHRDPTMEPIIKKVEGLLYDSEFRRHPVLDVTSTGKPHFVRHFEDAIIDQVAASRQHAAYMRELRYQSKIVVPVVAHDEIFGALTFIHTRGSGDFDDSDVEFATELGRRAGLAVANAKQFHREQYVATTLQRAFLTEKFPIRSGLRFYALYRPAQRDTELGGDWYDVFQTRRGTIVMTIGDVAGKGVEAARLMVQIRQAIRIGSIRSDDPGDILDLVNESVLLDANDRIATAFVGVYDPERGTLTYASAGQCPPLYRPPDDAIIELHETAIPIGVSAELTFDSHVLEIAPGSMLVFYTDGLTEVHRDPIRGEALLKDILTGPSILQAANPARFLERALCGDEPFDDIAVMVATFATAVLAWAVDAGNPRAVYAAKDDFLRAAHHMAKGSSQDFHACEVIFGELIGNCVRHAPGAVSFSLEAKGGSVWLNAIDEGPGFDFAPSLPFDMWAESGRGLYLAFALSRSVSVVRLPGQGTHVRVELPLDI
jgi:serine phosphatase RsbU (regulator of sigma subunit)/anti-sigma regulatory factor (Ser/Thr protein kinase)